MKEAGLQSGAVSGAAEAMIGAIVGVGMFGIPFAFAQAGFLIGMLYLIAIGIMMMTLFMMYSEIVLQTSGRHRVSGYVKKYLGRKWGLVAAFVMLGGTWGGLIAYILVGGQFLYTLLGHAIGGSLFIYQLLFLAIGFVIALRGLGFVVRIESLLVAALLLVVSILVAHASLYVDVQNFLTVNTANVLLPYGVVLFALGGFDIVPEMADLLGRKKRLIRRVIPISFSIIILLYAAFASAVVGVTGAATTQESLVGLTSVLGPWAMVIGSLMGILAVATSFILMSVQLQDMLEFDFGYTRLFAWFVTMSIPVIVFLLGARDFIEVMSFTGSVFGGALGIFVVIMYLRIRKRLCTTSVKCFAIPNHISYTILTLFILGILIGVI